MDEQVLRAMARWPDVPAVFGWLRLDARGRWLLVDRGHPEFDEARHGAGSPITSPQIIDFIGRNYAADAHGRWFWQNGPQRVYVDLELAPYVWRVLAPATADGSPALLAHTGHLAGAPHAAHIGARGELLLQTALGAGVVHDLDLALLELQLSDDLGSRDQGDGQARCGTLRWQDQTLAITPAPAPTWVARPR